MSPSSLRIGCLLLSACAAAPLSRAAPEETSARNASYRIEVSLDHDNRMLTGRQVLTWRNVEDRPTAELWFHLYWNAWRNDRSTWLLEDRLRERADPERSIREADWGWIEVDDVRLLSQTRLGEGGQEQASVFPAATESGAPAVVETPIDLSNRTRYAAPDDDNPRDRTVLVVALPREVGPGESVDVEMTWRAKIPRTFARTGFRGDFYFIAQWFPKVGVYEPEGWNCHQYHAPTEYYSDYGVYDVRITMPSRFVLGATGRRVALREDGDGNSTHHYRQVDVHDFAWTASPDFLERIEKFQEPGLPPVEMRLLFQPEHTGLVDRHFEATRAALKYYGTWYGPYPYGHVTIVDPAYGSGAGGMEYPTLFTCGARLFSPFGGDSPESVTVHEAGHQFWYGLIGNNEFEHAWLDEGFNTFSTLRTLEVAFSDRILVQRYLEPPESGRGRGAFFPLPFRDITVDRWDARRRRYRASALSDAPLIPTFRYHPSTGGDISYSKTALWLRTLERHLGWPTLQQILSTFFERYRFRHPTPNDFFAVANEVAGTDLSWFFDQIHGDSVVFDYAVDSVRSVPTDPEGWVGDGEPAYTERPEDEDANGDEAAASRLYRSEVVVKRQGGGVFPVDVLLVFEDGHERRERWDGAEHWKQFVVERPGKLRYAVVDPEHVLMLDVHPHNNGRLREPEARLPAAKWASKWMIWLQDLMTHAAFFL